MYIPVAVRSWLLTVIPLMSILIIITYTKPVILATILPVLIVFVLIQVLDFVTVSMNSTKLGDWDFEKMNSYRKGGKFVCVSVIKKYTLSVTVIIKL